jgi:hypothetical protein
MAVDAAKFVQDFPEFGNAAVFPPSGITFWLTTAYLMLRPERWGTLIDLGAELFAAHNLVLEASAQRSANTGSLPGIQTGAISSKAVDRVSISYDAQAGLEMDGGHWNLTTYGTLFKRFANMAGMGGLQITGGLCYPGSFGIGPDEGW